MKLYIGSDGTEQLWEWSYYNFALEVFTQRLCSRLYSIEVDFYSKKQKNTLGATFWPFWGLG